MDQFRTEIAPLPHRKLILFAREFWKNYTTPKNIFERLLSKNILLFFPGVLYWVRELETNEHKNLSKYLFMLFSKSKVEKYTFHPTIQVF